MIGGSGYQSGEIKSGTGIPQALER